MRELKYLSTWDYETFKKYGKSLYKNKEERKKHYDILKYFCKVNIENNGVMKRA